MNQTIVVLFASILVTGCASYCEVESFNRITPGTQVNGVRSYTDGPRHTILRLPLDVSLDVSSCYETGLCAEISLPAGRRMKFMSNEFLELDADGIRVIDNHKVPYILFTVTCEEDRKVPRTCSSSELSPTSKPVEVKTYPKSEHNDWNSQLYFKWFDSRLEFVGVTEIKGSLVRSWLSRSGSRKYEMRIFVDRKPGVNPYIIRFPAVEIDGVPYQLPDIRVNSVREEVCKSPPK